MGKVIAIVNNKGGVAKTTTTEHLGIGLAKAGYKVLLIDADPQNSLAKALGVKNVGRTSEGLELSLGSVMDGVIMNNQRVKTGQCVIRHEEGIDLLPAGEDLADIELKLSFAMMRESIFKNCITEIRSSYDYVLIDGSPSLNMMMVNILNAADSVLIPYNAEYLAMSGITQLINVIANVKQKMNPKLAFEGILVTMFNARSNNAKEIVSEVFSSMKGLAFIKPFNVMIPRSVKAPESSEEGVSLYRYAPLNAVAEAYVRLTVEFIANANPQLQKEVLDGIYDQIMDSNTSSSYTSKRKTRTILLAEEELDEYFPDDYSAGRIKREILHLLGNRKKLLDELKLKEKEAE